MANGNSLEDKLKLYVKRATHLNRAFLFVASFFYLICLISYSFFSMPVSPRLSLYMYALIVMVGVFGYGVAFFVKKRMFPIDPRKDPYWSYTATRRYFWSFVSLSFPFFISFVFYIFAGHLSSLTLGFIITALGLVLFRPRREDLKG